MGARIVPKRIRKTPAPPAEPSKDSLRPTRGRRRPFAPSAALALTDTVARITEGQVPDSIFERARAHFREQELFALVFTLTTISVWNRLSIRAGTEVANHQRKARPVSQTV